MPVGLGITQDLIPVAGIKLGVACAGIKKADQRDLVVIEIAPESSVSAVFTQNKFCAAPVQVAKKHLSAALDTRFLVINTGNANAGTGQRGLEDAIETCARLAGLKDLESEQVLPFSTGVIGEYLPMVPLIDGLPAALSTMMSDNWLDAAKGIMTTDTRPKGFSQQFEYQDETITVTGISKGSGMIQPNMATMLSFVATDAPVDRELLQTMIQEATEHSFNRITVDGDTSTNDANVLIATGLANVEKVTHVDQPLYRYLLKTIKGVMRELALQIVRDAEGATKCVQIDVNSAQSSQEALNVAYTIAHSPLVKTALTASDANWGRILAAIGRSPVEDLDVNQVELYLDDVCIVKNGERHVDYSDEAGSAIVAQDEFKIVVGLNRGDVTETVWTSDLSHDYVTINAEYRT